MSVERVFLDCSVRKFKQSLERVEGCLARLDETQVWARGSPNQNTVGNLVLHVCGNIQQWILSGVGGKPNDRDRDAEFAASGGIAPGALRERLHQTIESAIAVVEAQSAESLERKIQVQTYDVTVLEAIFQVVEHLGGHTGQVIFATKLLTGEDLGFNQYLQYRSQGSKTP